MSGWLLDTNLISELRRPRPSARVRTFIAGQPLEELMSLPPLNAIMALQWGFPDASPRQFPASST